MEQIKCFGLRDYHDHHLAQALLQNYVLQVLTNSNVSLNMGNENSKPLFFALNISDSSLLGSVYQSKTDKDNLVYFLISYQNGFHLLHYNLSTYMFIRSYTDSQYKINFIEMIDGYMYLGGVINSNSNAVIAKLIDPGTNFQNQEFVLIQEVYQINNVDSIYGIGIGNV